MHSVKLKQMRVHLRIAGLVVDKGNLSATFQKRFKRKLSHAAKAI